MVLSVIVSFIGIVCRYAPMLKGKITSRRFVGVIEHLRFATIISAFYYQYSNHMYTNGICFTVINNIVWWKHILYTPLTRADFVKA